MRFVKWLFPIVLLTIGLIWLVTPGLAQDATATPEVTPTLAGTALQRPTLRSTGLPTPIDSSRVTATPTRTQTPTRTPTRTRTATQTSTATPTASATNTATSTPTPTATDTATATSTRTFTATVTASATSTVTITPTRNASSPAVIESPTKTLTPTPTDTVTDTPTSTASNTATNTPTSTPTSTATATPTATVTPTATNTPLPINVVASTGEDDQNGEGLNPLVPIGGLLLLAGLMGYVSLYALNSRAIDRYAAGFVMHRCPVCETGNLEIEERPYRILGIPRVRRTVRCDNCRSVLREVGRRRWRYAVDPHANPPMYDEYNGDILTEAQLSALSPDAADQQPHYLDY